MGRVLNRAMAINAFNRRRRARFAVKQAVAMHIRLEMAIGALHSLGEMRVFQMNGFGKLHRVIVRNDFVVEIEQIALGDLF